MNDIGEGAKLFFGIAARCVAALAVTSPLLEKEARAQTTHQISFAASTAFDTNPFLAAGQSKEVASFRLEMAPTIRHQEDRSEFSLSARAEHVEYLSRYKSSENLAVNFAAKTQINERSEFSARLYAASVIASNDVTVLTDGVAETTPATPDITTIDDITLIGRQIRQTSFGAEASFVYRPSSNGELKWTSSTRSQRFARPVLASMTL
jgi:hypothetical protein